jgi:5-formyltetrahydrofolate cyclo-ligase
MVGPSPPSPAEDHRLTDKQQLRDQLRAARRAYVSGLPEATRALVFMRPPARVAAVVPEATVVGLYHALPDEAPTRGYAKWLSENGRAIALPWFANLEAPMRFRAWRDPYDDDGLEMGPHRHFQPAAEAEELDPEVVFVPLLGFTPGGHRLGQGGGHYYRWLAAHPAATALGLAWDCQLVDSLPTEPHDVTLAGVITPTRLFGALA